MTKELTVTLTISDTEMSALISTCCSLATVPEQAMAMGGTVPDSYWRTMHVLMRLVQARLEADMPDDEGVRFARRLLTRWTALHDLMEAMRRDHDEGGAP